MENIQKFIDDMNNDLENRKRGLPSNPFEKQGTFAELYPKVVLERPDYFFLNENYFPEATRDKIDTQNKETVILSIEEIRKANSFKQDTSMKRAA